MENFKETCFGTANILVPRDIDMSKWSVVACDQYTSEPAYWDKVAEIVGDAPSSLKITLPEVYLENDDTDKKIISINRTMKEYIPIFDEFPDAMIYVRRTMPDGKVRRGLVGAADLETYDYNKDSLSLIRATEGTVLDRIPPRVKVRENADLELPHVMLLADDPADDIMKNLESNRGNFKKIYDFELMQNGGRAEGYLLTPDAVDGVMKSLEKLADFEDFNKRYETNDLSPLLFAVGDGNHSLATAKTCFENLKKILTPEEAAAHPARYALVELVNLHDEALIFEPIHRVVFGIDPEKLLAELESAYKGGAGVFPPQNIKYFYNGTEGEVILKNPPSPLEVGSLQRFLDEYLKTSSARIDYIHGDDVTEKLGREKGNIGFILPPMSKESLFKTILEDGVLPRKTFSMGEAHEKRFYLECRKIK